MTPNLYLFARNFICPAYWPCFSSSNKRRKASRASDQPEKAKTTTFHSSQYEENYYPVPGYYTNIPGRGTFLTQRDKPISTLSTPQTSTANTPSSSTLSLSDPTKKSKSPGEPVDYCRVLHRYLLRSDLQSRTRWSRVAVDGKLVLRRFLRFDDGITWVAAWDEKGIFIGGGGKAWVWDEDHKAFRGMRQGDAPGWRERRESEREMEMKKALAVIMEGRSPNGSYSASPIATIGGVEAFNSQKS